MPDDDLRILIVDDDPGQRGLLCSFLSDRGFAIVQASSGREALDVLDSQPIHMVISDVRMPGMSGLDTLRLARKRFVDLPVLLVTAYADIRDAVSAMRDGALNYLEKPIDLDELLTSVQQTLGVSGDGRGESGEYVLPDGIVAESPKMRDVLREAMLVAPSDSRVLITGESGTGKEVVAELIHRWSSREPKPIVKVNCAAIPESLLESELFGHEKGAFTGATGRRVGRFEEANGTTILLDEVAEMSPGLQAKLLRVTQDGTFQRVGSNEERATDTRVLASTNRDLEQEVEAGRFREDLFYRLNVIELHLAPLRERREDIMPLAHLFAAAFSEGRGRFSSSVTTAMTLYPWPGNVRELRNAMERAMLIARGGVVLPEHLPRRVQRAVVGGHPSVETDGEGRRIAEMERAVILQTLREKRYNRTETAKALGISRRALIYKLRRLDEQGYSIRPDAATE